MLFCENCNYTTDEKHCPLCGNKKLRDVNDSDFCFFANLDVFNFSMLENAFKENDIDVVGVPEYSYGVTMATAGRAQGRKVYVRYKDTEKAVEIYKTIFGLIE